MRHLYVCPLRWADLDVLGHVNNVKYVDYLQEARVDMLRHHPRARTTDDLAEGVVVAHNRLTYLTPLTLRDAVAVEVWVTDVRAASFTLAYEVFDTDAEGNRIVFLRASSLLTPFRFDEGRPRRITEAERTTLMRWFEPIEPAPRLRFEEPKLMREGHWEAVVRFSDLDLYGHVNNVKYFEFFQEARIASSQAMFGDIIAEGAERPSVVVAQADVEYRRPVLLRRESYDIWSWISRVGTSSYDVSSELRDGDTVHARSRCTLVSFDPETQRAARPTPRIHQRLLDLHGR